VATLCDCAGGFGTWGARDTILFTAGGGRDSSMLTGIVSVHGKGGTPTPVTSLETGEIAHQRAWFLPDGRHFLYIAEKLGQSPIYVADLDAKDKQKSRREIRKIQTPADADAGTDALFTPPDFLLFRRGATLVAQRFDPEKGQLRGEELPVVEGVSRYSGSQNGVLVYESLDATIGRVQLTWFDRSGNAQGTVDDPRAINWPVISPDGAKLAYDAVSAQADSVDVWVHDLVRGSSERATFGQVASDFPQWSPDGSHFLFRQHRALHQAAADGSGEGALDPRDPRESPQPLALPAPNARADDWSRDGRFIAEEVNQSNTGDPQLPGSHIWIVPMSQGKPGKAFPFLRSPYTERWAKFSPDGRWLAYTSDETHRDEIYVQEFHSSPDGTSAAGGGKVRISNNGGSRPVWSRDGKELYYIAADRKLMAVPMPAGGRSGPALNPGTPKELFQTQIAGSIDYWFDVSRDGHFIMPVRVRQTSPSGMNVVLNWPSILNK
jgi:eukaryotic-like serine/threonine-protein kinase